MCRPKWYGFGVVLVWNRVITFAFLVWNRVWFWQGLPWDRTVHLFLLLFWHWPGTFIYICRFSGSDLKKGMENPTFWSEIGSGFWCKSYKGHEMKRSTCTTNSSYEHLTACFSVRRVLTWREMPPFLCAVVGQADFANYWEIWTIFELLKVYWSKMFLKFIRLNALWFVDDGNNNNCNAKFESLEACST